MSIRYTDLCKQMQKTAAVLLSSGIILQSCSIDLGDQNMKKSTSVEMAGKKRVNDSINVGNDTLGDINSSTTGRVSENGFDSEGLSSKRGSSGLAIGGAAFLGLAVGSLAFGLGFGLNGRDIQINLNTANDANDALTALNQNLTATNAQLNSTVASLNSTVLSSLTPDLSSQLINDINPLISSLGATVTVASNSNARLLQTSGASLLNSENLDDVTSITIPGNVITPYTANGGVVLNAVNTVLANPTSCPSSGASLVNTFLIKLGLDAITPTAISIPTVAGTTTLPIPTLATFDSATAAAFAASNVVSTANSGNTLPNTFGTYTVGSMEAVLGLIKLLVPSYATDSGYIAGLAAFNQAGSTQASVVAAINSAAGSNAMSSIIANAVNSVQPSASSGITGASCATGGTVIDGSYCSGGVSFTAATSTTAATCTTPANLNNAKVGCTNDFTVASGAVSDTAIVNAVNNAVGVASPKAYITNLLANRAVITATAATPFTASTTAITSYILDSINAAVAASGSSTIYTWTSLGLATTPTIDGGTVSSPTSIGLGMILPSIVEKLGANSIPAMVASAILNCGAITLPTASLGAGMSAPTNAQILAGIIASDPIWIDAYLAANSIGATCSTVSNAILNGLSMSPYSNYIQPTPVAAYNLGKMTDYMKYMTGLTSISLTGQTLSYPINLDLSGLDNLNSFSMNNSIVNNNIVLPNDLSVLGITNSTLCYGGGIISNTNGATLSNPGFINATANNNAVSFNTQTGTGPLCPGNVGSIPNTGFFSSIQSYSNLLNTCQSNLKASNSMTSTLQNATSQAITGANNCLLSNTNLTNYLNNYVGTLTTCVNKLQPLASNQNAALSAVANYCVGM